MSEFKHFFFNYSHAFENDIFQNFHLQFTVSNTHTTFLRTMKSFTKRFPKKIVGWIFGGDLSLTDVLYPDTFSLFR